MVERLTRNPRIFIAVAAVLALIVAGLVYVLLNNATKTPPVVTTTGPGGIAQVVTPTVQLKEVVAIIDVPAYTVLNSSLVIDKYFQEAPLPSGTKLPADAFGSMQDFLNYLGTGHPGRYTSAIVVGGQQVRQVELADLQGRQAFSLSLNMPKQRVASSVSVAQTAAVNGGIQAGDQVDVLLTLPADSLYNYKNPSQATGPQESQTLLQNVPVLAAAPPIYTLMLSHQDALILKYAQDTQNAGIALALRSWLDPAAKDFKTAPILPEYLSKSLKTNFTVPPTPLPTAKVP